MDKSEINAQRLMQAFYRVAISRRALFQDLLYNCGVTLHQFHLLLHMKEGGGVSVSDLSSMMMVSKPTASRMVNALCEKGLAIKTYAENDRRLVYVNPTARGRRVVDEVQKRQREMFSRVLSKMGEDEMDAFLETVEGLADGLVAMSRGEGDGRR